MYVWRHTCLSINLVNGHSLFYENGKLLKDETYEEYVKFREKMNYNGIIIALTSYSLRERYATEIGSMTDFQLFGRGLSKLEMKDWTGCRRRLIGDVINWEKENWFLNKTGDEDVSEIELLEFDKQICDNREQSKHIFPIKRSFTKALKLCEKIQGRIVQ